MTQIDRRDFLSGIIAALLLALFPWLRTSDAGRKVAKDSADAMLRSARASDIERALDMIRRQSGSPTHVFMNPRDWVAFQNEMGRDGEAMLAELESDDEEEAA